MLGEGAAIAIVMVSFLVSATLFSYFALARRKRQQGDLIMPPARDPAGRQACTW
jgi:hypothetical protein